MQHKEYRARVLQKYGMVRLESVGDVLFQALLLDDIRLDSRKIYTELSILYLLE